MYLLPVLHNLFIEIGIADSSVKTEGRASAHQEFFLRLGSRSQENVLFYGALRVHIPGQDPGGHRVIPQLFPREEGGHIIILPFGHPVVAASSGGRKGNAVSEQDSHEHAVIFRRHAADACALAVLLDDGLYHGPEFIPVLRLLLDSGLLRQIPAIGDGSVLDGLRLFRIGLPENTVGLSVHHTAFFLRIIQILLQIRIIRKIGRNLMQKPLAYPLIKILSLSVGSHEEVRKLSCLRPQADLVVIIIPCDILGHNGDIELVLQNLQHLVLSPLVQETVYLPIGKGDVQMVLVLGRGSFCRSFFRRPAACRFCQKTHRRHDSDPGPQAPDSLALTPVPFPHRHLRSIPHCLINFPYYILSKIIQK